MQAALYHEFCGPITVETVADPTPPDDGAVIRVAATGVCRSDWHGWQGHDDDIRTLPHVPGHELAGEVVAVGKQVRRAKVGQRVTMPFVAGCGGCPECHRGNQHVCDRQFQPGFTGWGSFAEYVGVRYADENLVELPESIDYTSAASLGCRFATAYRAVAVQAQVSQGEWLAVHGCGGVGLSAVMIGAALGARVIAIDVHPGPLQLAQQLGAEAVLDATSCDDTPAAIHNLTGRGAHASLDAFGSAPTFANSINCLRKRGRHVQVGLLAGKDHNTPTPMGRVISWELELVGSHGLQAHAYPAMLKLMEQGKLAPSQLIDRTITLDEAPTALARMDESTGSGVTVIKL